MSIPGESYEQWLSRTAPEKPVRTVNPRTWDWGVAVLLGVFFVWILVEGDSVGWIGLALALALAAEAVAHARLVRSRTTGRDRALRGSTLVVTLTLSGWLVGIEPGVLFALPVLLVLLDVKDERSSLRYVWARLRGPRRRSADGPRSQSDSEPSAV